MMVPTPPCISKSPLREICTAGSVGAVGGNHCLYPTHSVRHHQALHQPRPPSGLLVRLPEQESRPNQSGILGCRWARHVVQVPAKRNFSLPESAEFLFSRRRDRCVTTEIDP